MTCIRTYVGNWFSLADPKPEDVDIRDIAHALSQQCRFTGHVHRFYSVGEHSVRVSRLLQGEDRIHGLLHDAGEAYCGDVSRPLRMLLDRYDDIEAKVLRAVYKSLDIQFPTPQQMTRVRQADDILLATEMRDLMSGDDYTRRADSPLQNKIEPWDALEAEMIFLAEFRKLVEG